MAAVSVRDNRLIVTIEGLRRIWALKRGFDIPMDRVVSVAADPDIARTRKGTRAPGTYLPGVITAGTYFRKGDRNFWDVIRTQNVIVIELRDEPYRRLILEVEDPTRTVATINGAIAEERRDIT